MRRTALTFFTGGIGRMTSPDRRRAGSADNGAPGRISIFVPQTSQNPKTELLKLLNDPQPSPTSVLYMFCQCDAGAGNNPMLRFGSDNDPSNVMSDWTLGRRRWLTDLWYSPMPARLLGNDPYMANEFEEAFFERECRAFLGTETKVPIIFG